MRTPRPLAVLLIALAAGPLMGQEIGNYIDDILASESKTLTLHGSVFDVVAADFTTAATTRDRKAGTAYLRIAEPATNGWAVRVLSIDGTLLMTGAYTDAALTIPHGAFTYYYVNGQVESNGSFDAGVKKGVWRRYTAWGTVLSERVYDAGGADMVAPTGTN